MAMATGRGPERGCRGMDRTQFITLRFVSLCAKSRVKSWVGDALRLIYQ